jgi:hypothetical protein
MMTREKNPRDLVWDVLAEYFGEPRTKTERSQFGKVVNELMECGATPEETDKGCAFVMASFDNPSVFAVVKWLSASLLDRPKASPQQQAIENLRRIG